MIIVTFTSVSYCIAGVKSLVHNGQGSNSNQWPCAKSQARSFTQKMTTMSGQNKLVAQEVSTIYVILYYMIQIYSGITSGRLPDGELLYTKILEVNLFAFVYRLFFMKISLQSIVLE